MRGLGVNSKLPALTWHGRPPVQDTLIVQATPTWNVTTAVGMNANQLWVLDGTFAASSDWKKSGENVHVGVLENSNVLKNENP